RQQCLERVVSPAMDAHPGHEAPPLTAQRKVDRPVFVETLVVAKEVGAEPCFQRGLLAARDSGSMLRPSLLNACKGWVRGAVGSVGRGGDEKNAVRQDLLPVGQRGGFDVGDL